MADLVITTLAIAMFVTVARRNRPVRPGVAIVLALLTGAWLWANLRDPGWREVWNEDAADWLDPITRGMFWRGWPLAPFMVCVIHGNRFRPNGAEGLVLAFDFLVLFAVLSLVGFALGRWHNLRGREAEGSEKISCEKRPGV